MTKAKAKTEKEKKERDDLWKKRLKELKGKGMF
jgi:hypothetical protein